MVMLYVLCFLSILHNLVSPPGWAHLFMLHVIVTMFDICAGHFNKIYLTD